MPQVYDSTKGRPSTRKPKKKPAKKKTTPKVRVPRQADQGDRSRSNAVSKPAVKTREFAHPTRKEPAKVLARAQTHAQVEATKQAATRKAVRKIKVTPVASPDARDSTRHPAVRANDASVVEANIRDARERGQQNKKLAKVGARRGTDGKLKITDPGKFQESSEEQAARSYAPVLRVLEETTRLNHAVAGAADAAVKGENVPKAAVKGVKNEEKKTFADVLESAGVENKAVRGTVGFALDVATDPTTYATFGLKSAAAKSADKAARKAGRTAAKSTGAKTARVKATEQAVKQGAPPKQAKQAGKTAARTHARRAGAKAGEAAAAGKPTNTGLSIRFAGRDVPGITRATSAVKRGPRAVARKTKAENTRVGQKVDRAQQRVRDTARNFASDFNPAIAPAGVDRGLYQSARRSARTARAGAQRGTFKAGQRAVAFRKAIGAKNYEKVIDAIETGTIPSLPKELRSPARELQRDFAQMRKAETRAGIKVKSKGETYVKHLRLRPRASGGVPSVGSKKVNPSFAKGRAEGTVAEKNAREPGAYSTDVADIYLNRGAESAVSISKAKLNQAMVNAGRKPDRSVPIKEQLGEHETLYKVDGADLEKIKPTSTEAQTLPKGGRYVILNEKLIDRTRGTVGTAAERSTAGVFFDRAQGVWKLAATQVNPGYHVRNFAGEAQNAYLAENPIILGRNAVQAARALRQLGRDEDALRVLKSKGPGREPSTRQAVTDTRKVTEHVEESLDRAAQKSVVRNARKSQQRPAARVKVSADDAFSTRALPVEKTGGTPNLPADKTDWFHGTPTMFNDDLTAKGKWADMGVYLTSDPRYARGYADAVHMPTGGRGHILPIRVQPKRVLDWRAGRENPAELKAVVDAMLAKDRAVHARGNHQTDMLETWSEKLGRGERITAKESGALQSLLEHVSEDVGAAAGKRGTGNRHQALADTLRGLGYDAVRKVDQFADALVVLDESIMRRISGTEGAPTTRLAPKVKTETTTRTVKVRGKRIPEKRYQGIDIRTAESVGAVRAGQLGREVGDMLGGASAKHKRKKARRGTLRKPARALKNVEDVFRLATYKGGIDRGLSPEKAMERASRNHFDYGDLTATERKVLRRVFPFWTFSARNIPLQARTLLSRPGKFANYQKIRESFQEAFGVPEGWEQEELSESEQRAAPIPVKINGHIYNISLGPSGLPITDLNEFPYDLAKGDPVKQADEWMNRAMSMLTPAVKTPIELWANFSFFFRDQIERDTGPLAPAPFWVQYIPEKLRNELGFTKNYRDPRTGKSGWGGPAKVVYALGVLPGPIAFGNRLSTDSDRPGQSKTAKTIQYLGPRVRANEPVTVKLNRTYEDRGKLSKRINALGQQNHPENGEKISAKNATPEYRRLLDDRKRLDIKIATLKQRRGDPNVKVPGAKRPSGAVVKIPGTDAGRVTIPGTARIKIP